MPEASYLALEGLRKGGLHLSTENYRAHEDVIEESADSGYSIVGGSGNGCPKPERRFVE